MGPHERAAGAAGVDDLRRRGPGDRLRRRRRAARAKTPTSRLVARAVAVPPVRVADAGRWCSTCRSRRRSKRGSRDETGIRLGRDRPGADRRRAAGAGARQPRRGPRPTAAGGRPGRSAAAPLGRPGGAPRLGDRRVRHGQRAAVARAWSRCTGGSPPRSALGGAMSNVLLVLLAAVAALFLLIQGVALAHRAGAGPADHRCRARPLHRHPASAQPRLHPRDPGAGPRPARRAGRLVQRHDRRGDPAAVRRGAEGTPRAGVRHRPRDPDEAAAAGAADRAGDRRLGLLRAGARGGRRLLRRLPGGRAAVRLPDRRRVGQGRRRRALHGAAEGPGAVAGAPATSRRATC